MFPIQRPRRLRAHPTLRRMVRETLVTPADLIAPLFVQNAPGKHPISSMPAQFRLSIEESVEAARELWNLGVPSVILFGIVGENEKDATGSMAHDDSGPVPNAIRAIKAALPDMMVVADVCACEYTAHGHCGVLQNGAVDNDATLPLLAKSSLCYAAAGADIIAPSDMMDGRVGAIRAALDDEKQGGKYLHTPIMSYAAKFAGAFYGPFRDAADSSPSSGDRRGYQMDIANGREAMREMALDVEEGADILMVKPAVFCLDLLAQARARFDLPLCAYNVSSEYSMICAAAERGWIDGPRLVDETLTSIKRAGADLIVTYHARDWARTQ